MLAELILIGKLLGKTDLSKSTPSLAVRPKFFTKSTRKPTYDPTKKPTKQVGPALGLKKYF
jgi:hypothetical protein